MLAKEELLLRLYDLTDAVEHACQESFDDGEIEDLIVEAKIPITQSNGRDFG